MEQEDQLRTPETAPEVGSLEAEKWPDSPQLEPSPDQWVRRIFIGSQGLRAGWSVLVFIALLLLFARAIGYVFVSSHLIGKNDGFTARTEFVSELVGFLAMLGAAAVVAFIERRRILDYNLTGPRRVPHFVSGLASGFMALSVLVGALVWGGWLHFGPVALSGSQILRYAVAWGGVFLLVAFVEEGTMRCYLLFTLTRGINFWWAAGINGAICLDLILRAKGNGIWGVYAIALLGLIPCLLLHLRKAPSAGFWQATWVTSTLFGFGHTGNNGENWIGIFTAAFIGFVFCVSVRLTASAWWAIGCHAAWDWAETYFYGTADSGLTAKGHFLTTTPAGNPLWSGGTDGPEGSLLVLPVTTLLLVLLLVLYGRKQRAAEQAVTVAEQIAG
jgi:uncharacterized protein